LTFDDVFVILPSNRLAGYGKEARMGALEDRVAVITGAGRGMGREHALLFAREGAKVVVNDNGCDVEGLRGAEPVAVAVTEEIAAAGGTAIADTEDVSDFEGAGRLIEAAIAEYGRVDVLVNNAGILRDRMLWDMSEEDWDILLRNNLKGVFAPLRWAARHWKSRWEAGEEVSAAVVNISSISGLSCMPGQSNYGAAKAGVAALTVAAARELDRFGVRVNAIAPEARTRMAIACFEEFPDHDMFRRVLASMFPPDEVPEAIREASPDQLIDVLLPGDSGHPGRVSPFVAYLASEACGLTGQVIEAGGTKPVSVMGNWRREDSFTREDEGFWTIDEVAAALEGVGSATA
jgi:NAD(P)-dependent dehydrogenase (short-subunit alcohol dehydrogenase family)